MAVKEIKLNQAAMKLLAEYSEAEGVSPSEVVLRFVPKPRSRKMSVSAAEALLRQGNPRKLAGSQADKAAAAVDKSRSKRK